MNDDAKYGFTKDGKARAKPGPKAGVPWKLQMWANHCGYRVADAQGARFLLPDIFHSFYFEQAVREAEARGGIVVRADWVALEPGASEAAAEKIEIGAIQSQQDRIEGPQKAFNPRRAANFEKNAEIGHGHGRERKTL